jgi:hypothetical protein
MGAEVAQPHIPSHANMCERPLAAAATHLEDARQFEARGVRGLRLDCLKQPLLGDAASGLDLGQLQAHAKLGPGVAVRADVAAVQSPVPDSKIQLEMNVEGAVQPVCVDGYNDTHQRMNG